MGPAGTSQYLKEKNAFCGGGNELKKKLSDEERRKSHKLRIERKKKADSHDL